MSDPVTKEALGGLARHNKTLVHAVNRRGKLIQKLEKTNAQLKSDLKLAVGIGLEAVEWVHALVSLAQYYDNGPLHDEELAYIRNLRSELRALSETKDKPVIFGKSISVNCICTDDVNASPGKICPEHNHDWTWCTWTERPGVK